MNGVKYYVLYLDVSETIVGPMSFKEAIKVQKRATVPCEILKRVIDIDGKEVK